jgi:hypothetical protein
MPEGEERETSGEKVRVMNEEDEQRVRERRQRHHTRRWYEKPLLAIANGDVVPDQGAAQGATRLWPGQRLESVPAVQEIT